MMTRRGIVGRSLSLPVMLAALVPLAGTAAAEGNGSGGVDRFYGSYRQDVAIQVPPFHGIEPKLSLHYESSAGNGLVGVGWSLQGFSTIERASAGKGAPRYNASDIYLLDGQELVPCASQPAPPVSPSCTTGGTHSTKIESYVRIQKDVPATNQWTVTYKDGTRAVFGAVYTTASGQIFRWGLTSVIDTKNNAVTYNWWCDVQGASRAQAWTTVGSSSWTVPSGVTTATVALSAGGGGGSGYYSSSDGSTYSTGSGGGSGGFYAAYAYGGLTPGQGIALAVGGGGAGGVLVNAAGTAGGSSSFGALSATGGGGGQAAYLCCGGAGGTPGGTAGLTSLGGGAGGANGTGFGTGGNGGLVANHTPGTAGTAGWVRVSWTNPIADCYPDSATYNGTTVTFYRESRPDVVQFSDGDYRGLTSYRLKTVDVTVSGSRARAIKLAYTSSGSTGRSLLASVQQYGTDATLDASGTVMGGTALPAPQLTWSSTAAGTFGPRVADTAGATFTSYTRKIADVNGDGKSDVVYIYDTAFSVFLSNGDGTFGARVADSTGGANFASYTRTMADVNGDGKDDIVYIYDTAFSVFLSNGDGTFGARMADTAGATFTSYTRTMADVNGDGKADILYLYDTAFSAFLSSGDGTFGPRVAGVTGVSLASYSRMTADVNGDGRADLVYIHDTAFSVFLSNGDGSFGPRVADNTDGGKFASYTRAVADVNGDGKTDIVYIADANFSVFLASGDGTFGPRVADTAGATFTGYTRAVADVNGDGKADVVYIHDANFSVFLSSGDGSFGPRVADTAGATFTGYTRAMGDVNGDGKTDIVYIYDTAFSSFVAEGPATDVLTGIANGMGGTTTVAYTPSSAWANSNNPPVMQTVSAVTVTDGRGGTSTTSYSYAGGLFDRVERRFLGFRYSKVILPCLTSDGAGCTTAGQAVPGTSPYAENWWKQDYGSVSKPEETKHFGGDGRLLEYEQHEYTTNGATVPYTSLETGTWKYAYDGSPNPTCPGASCKRTYTSAAFDAYGNVTQQVSYGDYDVGGDESTQRYQYRPNATLFIVNKVAATDGFSGVGTAGTLLAQVLISYDGNATWDASPTAGLQTATLHWHDATSTYVEKTFGYDAWGNLISETNAAGAQATYGWDSVYHQYQVSTTNALGQQVSATWDARCGAERTMVDVNGQTTTKQYDALCRLIRADAPLGAYELHSYVNLGNPTTQYVEVAVPGPSGTGDHWTREYKDGLGRTYKTVARGPAAGQDVIVEVVRNARGAVASESAPYYAGATPVWASLTYDAIGRATRLTNADGTYRTVVHGAWKVTRTNELGQQVEETYNAFNKMVLRREWKGGVAADTSFTYDGRGELVRVTDAEGNAWTWTVDSLKRKIQSTNPNAGTWTYSYDAAGRMTAQVDAKGQRTEITYDALGRATQKVVKRTNGTVDKTITWAYDQARIGYLNKGHLTTMTDPSGTTTYDHDAGGRSLKVSRTVDGVTYTFLRGYDAGGRLLWTTYPDGDTVGTVASPLVYDAAGRLSTIPGIVTSTTYTARGSLAQQNNANGTVTTHTYSETRLWLTSLATTRGATTIQNLGYVDYDLEGKLRQVTSPFANEGWTYAYDDLGQLTSATNASSATYNQNLAYTAAGNTTSSSRLGSYSYPAPGPSAVRPHAATAAGANSYAYDAAGNMTSGAGRTITWDAENLPSAIGGTTFAYDGNGSRLKKVVGGLTTVYLGTEYEKTGTTVTKYVSLAGRTVAKRVGTTTYWLHTDHQGSVQVVTDGAGTEVQRRTYRSYGDKLSDSTGHVESRGYAGQRQDESGLVYLNARYYDPVLTRFISPDPFLDLRTSATLNGYAYAANDPVNRTDADGECFDFIEDAIEDVGDFFEDLGESLVKPVMFVAGAAMTMVPGLQPFGIALMVAAVSPKTAIAIAQGLNQVPVVGGLMALPFIAGAAVAQGDWQTAARAAATYLIAMAVIATAVALAIVPGLQPLSSVMLAGVAAFLAGFAGGMLIGLINGASPGQSFWVGASFGFFAVSVFSMAGAFSPGAGWITSGSASFSWNFGIAIRTVTVTVPLPGAWTMAAFSAATLLNTVVRGYTGPRQYRFDHRYDYIGPSFYGGNGPGGPMAGNTPWNWGGYAHDMAALREGYGDDGNGSLVNWRMAGDADVFWRTATGVSW